LIIIVVGSLLVVGIFVPLLSPTPAGLTRTAGLDSPLYYARFIVLSAIYTAVVTAIVVLLSALVHAVHRALVGVVVTILFLAIGFDLAIVIGLASGVVAPDSLSWYLALSPASAYRGLVMTYVVSPVASLTVDAAAPLPSILGLLFWFLTALLTAAWVIWRPATYTIS
jgi:ABC-2 type transport system permease protein